MLRRKCEHLHSDGGVLSDFLCPNPIRLLSSLRGHMSDRWQILIGSREHDVIRDVCVSRLIKLGDSFT